MGAGSVLAELPGTWSPEAEMAIATFARFRQNLGGVLFRCGSGKELVERGFALDVELAGEYAISRVGPGLTRGQFIDGSTGTASRGLTIDPPSRRRGELAVPPGGSPPAFAGRS